jgi:hypothetical protein
LASRAQDDGGDIVFATDAGIKLDHEIEHYAGGSLVAWVSVPNLSSTVDTVLYMYYGNAGASDQQNEEAVWSPDYVMVQHLEEEATPKLGWRKYEGNPILSGLQNGFASIFYESETSTYHMYCSWGSILHFTSSDGKNWMADPSNPVLSGNGEGVPMVWKEGGIWYMLYRYGSPLMIGLANSTDAVHWTRCERNPVLTGDVGQWDDPSYQLDPWGIIKVSSTYYLWYNTIGSSGSLGRCTGLATSTNLVNWTKDTNNPIFTGGRFCPFPFKQGGYYYLLVPKYTVTPHGQVELYRDVNPTFYPGEREYLGIALDYGALEEWDESRFDTPCVLTDTVYRDTFAASDNELWTYYSGKNETGGYDWWTGMCIEQNVSEAISRVSEPVFSHFDSTRNQNDGNASSGVDMNVTGKINGGDEFNGANGYIDIGDQAALEGMKALTVETWVKPNITGGSGIVAKWNSWTAGTGGSYILWQNSTGSVGWGIITENSTANFFDTPVLQVDEWYHLVGIYDGSGIRLYVNGTEVGTPKAITGKIASTNDTCYIGRYTTPYLNGTLDEVRISNVSRSAEWVSTEYNNQASPSTFYDMGSEETRRTKIYVNPSLVEKEPSDAGSSFTVNVTIQNVTDLFGFDLNLTWDSSLLTLTNADYEAMLDDIWGLGSWALIKDQTGAGWYKLVAVSTLSGFNGTGDQPLVKLTFLVTGFYNWDAQTPIHFSVVKLSDSNANPIFTDATDGTYTMSAMKPALEMRASATTCRKYCERFNVSINIDNALNVKDFKFELRYNTTLLDFVNSSDVWGDLGAGAIAVNKTAGIIEGNVSSVTPISGDHWLLNFTFHAAFRWVWRNESLVHGWRNNQNGMIQFNWANLSYFNHEDLQYQEGGSGQITVNMLQYIFSPIQGDVDNNGDVDVFDLRTIGYYYDVDSSNPQWVDAWKYDSNGDNIIDIFDIAVIAANFGYTYDCWFLNFLFLFRNS